MLIIRYYSNSYKDIKRKKIKMLLNKRFIGEKYKLKGFLIEIKLKI